MQPDGEDQNRHQPEPEVGHAGRRLGDQVDGVVEPAAHLRRRQRPDDEREGEGKDERNGAEGQRVGDRPEHHLHGRPVVPERCPELEPQHLAEPVGELVGHRPVEPEALPHGVPRREGGVDRQVEVDRVAGEPDHEEDGEHQACQRQQRVESASKQVGS